MTFVEDFDLTALIPLALDVVGAIVLLIVTIWVARWSRKMTRKSLERGGMDATLTKFVSNLVRYGILVLGGLTVLSVFGVSVASFAGSNSGHEA